VKEAADNGRIKVAVVVGGHDERAVPWHRGQLDDPHLAGDPEKETATLDHKPVKGSAEELLWK